MIIKLEKTLEITLPKMPNFLQVTESFGDSSIREETFDVADFTVNQLRQIGDAWKEELLKHAENRRADKVENKLKKVVDP